MSRRGRLNEEDPDMAVDLGGMLQWRITARSGDGHGQGATAGFFYRNRNGDGIGTSYEDQDDLPADLYLDPED